MNPTTNALSASKPYVAPSAVTEPLLSEDTLMLGSPLDPGAHSGDIPWGTRGRRGTWGNLWYDEDESTSPTDKRR